MKLFFVTPHFSLFFSLVFCILLSTPELFAQGDKTTKSLSAVLEKEQVKLTWVSTVEEEIDYFVVERSLNERTWETLVQIEGAGYQDAVLQYQTTDAQPYEGTSFYRLTQTDYSGKVTIFSSVEVLYEVSMDQFFMSQDKAVSKMRNNH